MKLSHHCARRSTRPRRRLGGDDGRTRLARHDRPAAAERLPPRRTTASAGTTDAGGRDFSSILLPKCTGIAVFDQANEGAIEAAGELGVAEAEFVGPAS